MTNRQRLPNRRLCESFMFELDGLRNAIRKALCRDSQGRALGPIGAALDLLASTSAVSS